MLEPGELLSTMDAKVWADEFMETKARLGEKEFDHAMMLGWFANAIMAGFDEATRRQQATIADLQGQLKAAKAPRMYDCGSCAIGKGFEQRVAQLEGDVEEQKRNYLNACETIYKMYVAATGREGVAPKRGVVEDLADLQADHARVLGLVRALPVAERKVKVRADGIFRSHLTVKMVGIGDEMTLSGTPELIKQIAALLQYRASLPAQPAQGGASKPVTTCNRHSDCDAADEKARAKGALHADHCHDDCCSECFGN